jgi:predicted esterase YcpF (UPF0227 family)
MIINLHGYNGNSENAMYHILKDLFPDERIVSPQIDYEKTNPSEVVSMLRHDTPLFQDERLSLIVGTSLGALLAGALSYQVFANCSQNAVPTVLLNPCLLPWQYLPLLGYTGDLYYEDYALMFAEFARASVQADWLENACLLLGNHDETIDHDFCERLFACPPEGMIARLDCGHSIAGDPPAIAKVKAIVKKFYESHRPYCNS